MIEHYRSKLDGVVYKKYFIPMLLCMAVFVSWLVLYQNSMDFPKKRAAIVIYVLTPIVLAVVASTPSQDTLRAYIKTLILWVFFTVGSYIASLNGLTDDSLFYPSLVMFGILIIYTLFFIFWEIGESVSQIKDSKEI